MRRVDKGAFDLCAECVAWAVELNEGDVVDDSNSTPELGRWLREVGSWLYGIGVDFHERADGTSECSGLDVYVRIEDPEDVMFRSFERCDEIVDFRVLSDYSFILSKRGRESEQHSKKG